MLRSAPVLAALTALLIPLSITKARSGEETRPTKAVAALSAFQEREQRVQDIGWRLVRGNAKFCDTTTPSIGLQLQDMAMFADPDAVRTALGLSGDFAVQTAAQGSPAGRSGAFSANREIAFLGGVDPNQWPAGERLHWQRLTQAHDWIDQRLNEDSAITVRFADGTAHTFAPVSICATRFELQDGAKGAMAEGARVIIGSRFVGLEWEEDAVLAGAIAHELAHNLLHHRRWLDRRGDTSNRKRREVRLTEREADRLIPWLLANAGYDPAAAHAFMLRWGKNHDPGIFRARTHDGWDERAEFIEAELAIIAPLIEAHGQADWSKRFRREIDPQSGPKPANPD